MCVSVCVFIYVFMFIKNNCTFSTTTQDNIGATGEFIKNVQT